MNCNSLIQFPLCQATQDTIFLRIKSHRPSAKREYFPVFAISAAMRYRLVPDVGLTIVRAAIWTIGAIVPTLLFKPLSCYFIRREFLGKFDYYRNHRYSPQVASGTASNSMRCASRRSLFSKLITVSLLRSEHNQNSGLMSKKLRF